MTLRSRLRRVDRLRRLVRTARGVGAPARRAARDAAEIARYPGFVRELHAYRALDPTELVAWEDIYPCLDDRTASTAFDPHYLYQAVWALEHIRDLAPSPHVDVGSDHRFVAAASVLTDVVFVDIRPLDADLPGLTPVRGSLAALPFADASQQLVSCLHVVEHVGLGRYGDPLDPRGTEKACRELERVVAPGGSLLLSLPVGRARTCFNAHRVHRASDVPGLLAGLRLEEFSLVDDEGALRRFADLEDGDGLEWGCGLFRFRRDGRAT